MKRARFPATGVYLGGGRGRVEVELVDDDLCGVSYVVHLSVEGKAYEAYGHDGDDGVGWQHPVWLSGEEQDELDAAAERAFGIALDTRHVVSLLT